MGQADPLAVHRCWGLAKGEQVPTKNLKLWRSQPGEFQPVIVVSIGVFLIFVSFHTMECLCDVFKLSASDDIVSQKGSNVESK